jgi:hypothetical protein
VCSLPDHYVPRAVVRSLGTTHLHRCAARRPVRPSTPSHAHRSSTTLDINHTALHGDRKGHAAQKVTSIRVLNVTDFDQRKAHRGFLIRIRRKQAGD